MGRKKSSVLFVHGMLQRSGTNFASRLLRAHPHVVAPAVPVREDYLVYEAKRLLDYSAHVAGHWDERWGDRKKSHDALLRYMGASLFAFLAGDRVAENKLLVSKTPSCRGLDILPRLLPDAVAVVMVRDGRNLVASGMRAFDWPFETAVEAWAGAAKTIVNLHRGLKDSGFTYMVVRYEGLHRDPTTFLKEIFRVTGLDPALYDYEAAKRLPVYGSSDLATDGEAIHWEPVDKSPDFDPLNRWRDWSDSQIAHFNEIAGPGMRALGYKI